MAASSSSITTLGKKSRSSRVHTVVVRVTSGPRWDAEGQRYQYPGEEITISSPDYGEFVARCADHEIHCQTVLSGEWPAEVDTPGYPRIYPSLEPDPEPEPEAPVEPEPVYEGPVESTECPACKQAFRTEAALRRHMARCVPPEPEAEETTEE